MKQFSDVNCASGAPMGRRSYGRVEDQPSRSVSLFRVRFVDGDYDDGGAYWGGGWGVDPLYCARTDDGEFQQFTRAKSRADAAAKLGIPSIALKAGARND